MNAIWGAHLLSLTKLIVVVDDDCDVHDYHEVAFRAFGNVDYAHDLLLTAGPGRPPRPRVVPAVLGRQGGHRRHPQAADRGLHPGLAGGDARCRRRSSPWSTSAGRSTASDDRGRRPPPPARSRAFLRLVDDRALGLRAAVRLPGRADRDAASTAAGSTGCDLLLITVAMVGGPHVRDGRQPDHRPADRRAEPAYRQPGTGHRRGVSVRTAWIGAAVALVRVPRRRGRCSTRSACCWRRSPWSRWSSTRTPSGSPTGRTRSWRWPRRSRRSAPGSRSPAPSPAPGRPGCSASRSGCGSAASTCIYACQDAEVDRRIGVRSVPGPVRRAVRAARSRPSAHVVTFALFVWFGVLVGLGWLWWIGLALTAVAFVYEHASSRRTTCPGSTGPSSPPTAFVGIALFVFALADLVLLQGLRVHLWARVRRARDRCSRAQRARPRGLALPGPPSHDLSRGTVGAGLPGLASTQAGVVRRRW